LQSSIYIVRNSQAVNCSGAVAVPGFNSIDDILYVSNTTVSTGYVLYLYKKKISYTYCPANTCPISFKDSNTIYSACWATVRFLGYNVAL
jgi:CRISPR/Cas system-associated endonuclease Cas1